MMQKKTAGAIVAIAICLLVGYGQGIAKGEDEPVKQRPETEMKELGKSGAI